MRLFNSICKIKNVSGCHFCKNRFSFGGNLDINGK
jgi:hypothetical protein